MYVSVVLFYLGQDKENIGYSQRCNQNCPRKAAQGGIAQFSQIKPSQMPWYYLAGDVLLCASKQEGSPNVVKEALACNFPVVSSPVGNVAERLSGVYPSKVVERMPQAMEKALLKVLICEKRSNGRERIAPLGLSKVAKRVLDIYFSTTHLKVQK